MRKHTICLGLVMLLVGFSGAAGAIPHYTDFSGNTSNFGGNTRSFEMGGNSEIDINTGNTFFLDWRTVVEDVAFSLDVNQSYTFLFGKLDDWYSLDEFSQRLESMLGNNPPLSETNSALQDYYHGSVEATFNFDSPDQTEIMTGSIYSNVVSEFDLWDAWQLPGEPPPFVRGLEYKLEWDDPIVASVGDGSSFQIELSDARLVLPAGEGDYIDSETYDVFLNTILHPGVFIFEGYEGNCYGCQTELEATVTLLEAPTDPIPEPATMTLLGLGMAGLALRRKFGSA